MVDCQANLLSRLDTRFVVPLLAPRDAPSPARHLNPSLEIDGEHYIMVTQFAATMPVRELGMRVVSLTDADFTITGALDCLMRGV